MITVQGPIKIETGDTTVYISISTDNTIIIEVYQKNGKKCYMTEKSVRDGTLRLWGK